MDTYIYAKVDPSEIPQVWTQVKPLVERAMATARGESNAEHFRRAVLNAKMDLFVAIHESKVVGAMLTQFVMHPNYTALRICVMAGSEPHVLVTGMDEYWPRLIEWSKQHGAETWEAFCHPGMARLLQRHGFSEKYAMCVMPLKEN